jgi:hypothetical protein
MKIRAREERTKRVERDGERTDDEAQTPTLRLFVMVNLHRKNNKMVS